MKELLHSKLFRRNLYKWLFMYVGVMCLLTSVITYSKYITSMQNDDTARVARFEVKITNNSVCDESEDKCDYGTLRPTEDYEYYFTVDTTGLEVKTLLVTIVSVHEDFNNIKLYDAETDTEFNNYVIEDNKVKITETINPGDNYIRKYKLTCEFDSTLDATYIKTHNYSDAVVVGYSATQIK